MEKLLQAFREAIESGRDYSISVATIAIEKHLRRHPMASCILNGDDIALLKKHNVAI